MEFDPKEDLLRDLSPRAESLGLTLHDSFASMLETYAFNPFVRELPAQLRLRVLQEVGREAIRRAGAQSQSMIGGGSIREILNDLCNDPFSDCRKAATRILGIDLHSDAEITIANPIVQMRLDEG